ncbi:prestin-like [Halichondria panicea]|uniref:prestin-like n=1 Tax=Halichondria panicea TaxID=6063 RepID=UPI00312B71BD
MTELEESHQFTAEDEEEKAERAKEFLSTLNRKRPSRKRYNVGARVSTGGGLDRSAQFTASSSAFEASAAPFGNPFTTSVSPSNVSVDGAHLGTVGGDSIFREINEKDSLSKVRNCLENTIPQPIRNSLLPPRTAAGWRRFLFVHLPVLHWLWLYKPKQIIGDLIAGITIGVTHIPQGIGFALLAFLPPVYGLYSSFVPVIVYSILGTSKHISVGTFPVVALMVGNAITRLTNDLPECMTNSTLMEGMMDNSTDDPCALSDCDSLRVEIAVTISLMVGILMIVMSLLRFGFITLFLSDALVSGYTAAAAFTIFITQVAAIFGLNPEQAALPAGMPFFTTPQRVITYSRLIFTGQLNWAAVITSIVCILILIGLDFINSLLRKHVRVIPLHIPAQLVVVILATGVSYGAMLNERFELPIINNLGGIPLGLCFGVTLPNGNLLTSIISDAFVIAIISFVINISQAKLLAKKNSYTVHPDQEFLAYGSMNLVGAFFGSFPTAGALSRTVLQDATGGNTQMVGFISSVIVFLVIEFLGSLFGRLPNAALAAIVVVALKGLYLQVRDIYKYFKLSWADMLVWIVVFVATLVIGLDLGLGLGVLFSLLVIIVRTILPYSPQLGETGAWYYPPEEKLANDDFDEEELKVYRIPKIYIFQFNAPLYFANSGVFRSRLYLETTINPSELSDPKQGCIQQGCLKLCKCCSRSQVSERSIISQMDDEDSSHYIRFEESKQSLLSSTDSEEDEFPYHTIVIDCAPIVFVDSMGANILEQMVREYDSCGVQVLLSAPTTPVCVALKNHGFFNRFSSERLFPSVATAVKYARDGNRVPELEQTDEQDISLATNLERQLLYTARPSLIDTKPIELDHRGRSHSVRHTVRERKETETEL